MSLLDRIFPKGSKASEVLREIEEKRDEAIKSFEDAKIKETWYEHVSDTNNVIRVVEIQNTIINRIRYRTLANIREIENETRFTRSGDENVVYDCREPHHNSENCVETVFNRNYRLITDSGRISQLENRYQEVLRGYGVRMEAFKTTFFQQNPSESERRLREFLNPSSTEVSSPEREVSYSGLAFTSTPLGTEEVENVHRNNYAAPLNPYGGHAEIPASIMPDDWKKGKELEEKEDKQISQNPQKRLESIE
jgi:hypothetical protein